MIQSAKSNSIVQDEQLFRTTHNLKGVGAPIGIITPIYEGQEYINLVDGQKYFAYNEDQLGELTDLDWSPFLTAGLVKTFGISSSEGNQNMNSGSFFGVLEEIPTGLFMMSGTITDNLNLSAGQSFVIRSAVYDTGTGDLISEGSVTVDENTSNNFHLMIHDKIYREKNAGSVKLVIGANDNIGGGSLPVFRQSANGVNNSDIVFQFQNPTGSMPGNLSDVTVNNTTNVFYHSYFG